MEKKAREVRAAETNTAERSTLMKSYLVSIHACNAFGFPVLAGRGTLRPFSSAGWLSWVLVETGSLSLSLSS